MNNPQTRPEIVEALRYVQTGLTQTVQAISAQEFDQEPQAAWSAAGYLKHLILSIKPVVKALALPQERLQSLFALSTRPSMTYEALVAQYEARLAEGIRAEDYTAVTPVSYRFPDGTEDQQVYLLTTWNEANTRLIEIVEAWHDADLDIYQLPHPAIGLVTVREMLFFTVHHNTLHWQDIQHTLHMLKGG